MILILVHIQHNFVFFFFFFFLLWAGLFDSKPDVISLLEQEKEPWMVKSKEPKEWCPGEWWWLLWGRPWLVWSPRGHWEGSTYELLVEKLADTSEIQRKKEGCFSIRPQIFTSLSLLLSSLFASDFRKEAHSSFPEITVFPVLCVQFCPDFLKQLALLRYKSHILKFTYLKYTVWGF